MFVLFCPVAHRKGWKNPGLQYLQLPASSYCYNSYYFANFANLRGGSIADDGTSSSKPRDVDEVGSLRLIVAEKASTARKLAMVLSNGEAVLCLRGGQSRQIKKSDQPLQRDQATSMEQPDWAGLPSDVILKIAEALNEKDKGAMRATCKDWVAEVTNSVRGISPSGGPSRFRPTYGPFNNSSLLRLVQKFSHLESIVMCRCDFIDLDGMRSLAHVKGLKKL